MTPLPRPSTSSLRPLNPATSHNNSNNNNNNGGLHACVGAAEDNELKRIESFKVDPFGCKCSWNDAKEDKEKKDGFGTCGHGVSVQRQQVQ